MKARKLFKIIALNLILASGLLELLAVIIYFQQNGVFFYTRPTPPASVRDVKLIEDEPQIAYKLQPYWAYGYSTGMPINSVLSPVDLARYTYPGKPEQSTWLDMTANNFGFMSRNDFPLAPDKNTFFVGIFGGSVAHWFGIQATESLKTALANLPQFKGKKIEILNFGLGGGKQPQQLLILNFFYTLGQHLDLVLNIDGYNEVYIAPALKEPNHLNVAMPNVGNMTYLLSLMHEGQSSIPRSIQLGKLLENRLKIKSAQRFALNHPVFDLSATANLLSSFYLKWLERKQGAEEQKLNALTHGAQGKSLMNFAPWAPSLDGETSALKQIASVWAESSVQMRDVVEKHGGKYFHFLQPNQYVGRHRFSAAEKLIALNDVARAIPVTGYPALLAKATYLRQHQVVFTDLTASFDQDERIIYSDHYCHLNQTGNEIMAAQIMNTVKAGL